MVSPGFELMMHFRDYQGFKDFRSLLVDRKLLGAADPVSHSPSFPCMAGLIPAYPSGDRHSGRWQGAEGRANTDRRAR